MKINNKIWRFLTSIRLTVVLLIIIAAVSVIGTLIPQNASEHEYLDRYGQDISRLFAFLKFTGLYQSWWFILLLSMLGLNLLACTINRFSLKRNRIGLTLTHLSMLVIFAGAMIGGLWGQRGYMQVFEGQAADTFYAGQKPGKLDFEIYLEDFLVEYYPVKDICCSEHIKVSFKDKEVTLLPVEIGKEYSLDEIGYRLKVLRYVPDFVMDTGTKDVISRSQRPDNPALQVEIIGPGSDTDNSRQWIFARHPQMHGSKSDLQLVYHWAARHIKQFKSRLKVIEDGQEMLSKEIMVNRPMRYKGWTFYQASYDQEGHKWSGLQVSKDPGVAVVYIGFILLSIGLFITFYLRPFFGGIKL